MFTEKKFKASEVEINYAEGPANGPPILLLHGITSNWKANLLLTPHLTQNWQVFAPDFRGHGKSGRTTGKYALSYFAKDIIEFIKQEIKQPVIIFGHSLGGFVTGLIAAEIPDLVKGIIIGDASFDSANVEKWLEPLSSVAEFWVNALESNPTEMEILQMLLQTPIKLPDKDEYLPNIDCPGVNVANLHFAPKSYTHLDPEIFQIMKDIKIPFENYTVEDILPKITCPVLLLRADPKMGALMTDEDIELAKKYIKNLSYIKYEGICHSLHLRKLAPIANAIVTFSILLSDM